MSIESRDENPSQEKDETKYEEAEEVGLEGLAPDKKDEDAPPSEDTRTPHDDA